MYKIPNTDLIAMDESEYLEHFGTKGMKWGHRKALQPSREKMRASGKTGSYRNATDEQRAAYSKASAEYYNKKRKLQGRDAVNDKTAAYRQDIKNDAVKSAKFLAGSYILNKSSQALAMYSRHSKEVTPFLSNVTGISAALLKGVSIGTGISGGVYGGRAGIKYIKGGADGK